MPKVSKQLPPKLANCTTQSGKKLSLAVQMQRSFDYAIHVCGVKALPQHMSATASEHKHVPGKSSKQSSCLACENALCVRVPANGTSSKSLLIRYCLYMYSFCQHSSHNHSSGCCCITRSRHRPSALKTSGSFRVLHLLCCCLWCLLVAAAACAGRAVWRDPSTPCPCGGSLGS